MILLLDYYLRFYIFDAMPINTEVFVGNIIYTKIEVRDRPLLLRRKRKGKQTVHTKST
jgi:hypothetical protein